jgi:hypothetical protein
MQCVQVCYIQGEERGRVAGPKLTETKPHSYYSLEALYRTLIFEDDPAKPTVDSPLAGVHTHVGYQLPLHTIAAF